LHGLFLLVQFGKTASQPNLQTVGEMVAEEPEEIREAEEEASAPVMSKCLFDLSVANCLLVHRPKQPIHVHLLRFFYTHIYEPPACFSLCFCVACLLPLDYFS